MPAIDVEGLLAKLDAEQRAAATLPDGPAQIIAPAGSGKTTTLVARLGVLLSRGVPADRICVLTFNRDAAQDLSARVRRRLLGAEIEIRTLHALARRILLASGDRSHIVADRLPLLRAARRRADARLDVAALDILLSAWKVEGRESPAETLPIFETYATLLRSRGAVDFDDLVLRAGDLLESDARARAQWQSRFHHVCVDEFQDVDAAQLRLIRLLAAPQDSLFVVGDDDQTIYAWRLADVRRMLRFADDYPAARRVMLATNYRCPPGLVRASSRMIAVNAERFVKPIRPSPGATGSAADVAALDTTTDGWTVALAAHAAAEAAAGRTVCFLSRTRSELMPMLIALVRAGLRHATSVPLEVNADTVTSLVDALRRSERNEHPFSVLRDLRIAREWCRGDPGADDLSDAEVGALDALLGWSVGFADASAFVVAFDRARTRLAELRDPSALIELATVHGSKGREWQTVVLIGFEADRIPNRRSIADAADASRAMEEERRLAYVALTRARRRLILAYDPRRPSPFLAEMGLRAD